MTDEILDRIEAKLDGYIELMERRLTRLEDMHTEVLKSIRVTNYQIRWIGASLAAALAISLFWSFNITTRLDLDESRLSKIESHSGYVP